MDQSDHSQHRLGLLWLWMGDQVDLPSTARVDVTRLGQSSGGKAGRRFDKSCHRHASLLSSLGNFNCEASNFTLTDWKPRYPSARHSCTTLLHVHFLAEDPHRDQRRQAISAPVLTVMHRLWKNKTPHFGGFSGLKEGWFGYKITSLHPRRDRFLNVQS